ncbi:MAG: hypothetical protein PF495_16415, partial [Spirochaetales bacterium]|nr:hypothetical protein [Spirochaetales bacterium]
FDYIKKESCSYILSEDGVLSLLLNLLNKKIYASDQSLVLYRAHSDSLTNAPKLARRLTVSGIEKDINKSVLYAISSTNRLQFILRFCNNPLANCGLRRINREEINLDIRTSRMKSEWMQTTFGERLRYLLNGQVANEVKWMLPRLFGMNFFIALKYLTKNFRYTILRLSKKL